MGACSYFIVTANAAELLGATVDFVDISLLDFNISAEKLESKLEKAN